MIEQLGEYKHINSVNTDLYKQLFLKTKNKEIVEYDVTNVLNVSEQFDKERQESNNYFIYGGIEFFSLLNGVSTNYEYFEDFFNINISGETIKTIYNSFDFYLVKPSNVSGETYNNINNNYVRKFEIIAKNDDFIIEKQGFSKNIFGDTKYYYFLNKNIILNDNIDWFGKPITELYIMPIYKKSYTGYVSDDEKMYLSYFYDDSGTTKIEYEEISGDTINYNVGDVIDGDLVNWNLDTYSETILDNKKIKIETFYDDSGTTKSIMWKYDLFIPIRIDYLENEINIDNISGKTYIELPNHAIKLDDNGNYIWKNIIDKGYIDNLYNIGSNYPFVNGKHYLYNNIIIKIIPDLDDVNTNDKFNPIKITGFDTENNNTDISNYGETC